MCGRYSIGSDGNSLRKHFDAELADGVQTPNFNASPTNLLPVITNQAPKLLKPAKWGFVYDWTTKATTGGLVINARQETVAEKKMFSHLANSNRCLIPADGFFEWQKSGKSKQPFRFILKSEGLFSFAGLFKTANNQYSNEGISFVILTTTANSLVGELHDRMPVIISNDRQEEWLALPWKKLQRVFEPYPAQQMKSYKVTPRINSAGYNFKDAIIPWQDPNLTLF